MAKPNLINATSIYAKSLVHTGTATSVTVLSCPADKIYRITSFAVTGNGSVNTNKVKWEAMEKQVKKIHKWAGVSIAVNEAVNKRNKKLGIDPKIN